jgi:ubiquinone biosynthesis monooxygenase Coq7
MMLSYSKLDQFLIELQNSILSPRPAKRISPAQNILETELSASDKKFCASLMRINHTGEICAQALYLGQALVAKDEQTKEHLLNAADEETDHLAWCAQRLEELNDRPSILNLGFFSCSVLTGMLAGLFSDKISLGFIAETEQQVADHLSDHLLRLPEHDQKSRAIITQMQCDEIKHQQDALAAGGEALPQLIQLLMSLSSKIMTKSTYYI